MVMYEDIHKYLKQHYKIIGISAIISLICTLISFKRIGIKNSAMLLVALFFLILDIYLIYEDKRKSILLFLLLLPIFTTVRRLFYFDLLFMKITFETTYITILFLSSVKDVLKTLKGLYKSKNILSYKFIFLMLAFIIFCINSSFYGVEILGSLREVYIGLLAPIMLMLCFITYFNKEDKYKVYYFLIVALNFSCVYGYFQLLSKGVTLSLIKKNRMFLTFGFHNVNIFAGILISILPLLLEMILYKKNSKKEKLFLYLSFLNYSLAILISFSRGAWLCYLIVLFISLISKKYKKIIFAMLIPGVILAKPAFSYIINRGTTTSFLNNESAVARMQSIFTDLIIMKNYPFGIGGGNFSEAYKKFSFQGYLLMPENIRFNSTAAHYPLEHAHNLLLQIGVEFGLIAAIVFIFIIINRLKFAKSNFQYNRGALNSVIIYSIFSLVTGNEFNHKGVITGTLVIFIVFGIIELSYKRGDIKIKESKA
ncbi:O-antigen ligase like membrane protein [Clostridium tetani]|nr:O-antigen ligase like membrane protein [Clostridium tetani]